MEPLCKNVLECPDENNGIVLIRIFRNNNLFNVAALIGEYLHKLFPYNTIILSESAFSSYYAKKYDLSYKLYSKLLKYTPVENITNVLNNRRYSIPHIQNKYILYKVHDIKKIEGLKILSFVVDIKHMNEYESTLNSFLNCCLDKNKIHEWLFLDSNISEKDKKNIKDKYPFFKFINNIDEIKTKYVIYLAIESIFFSKKQYIHECMSILNHSKLEQCCINKLTDNLILNKSVNNIYYFNSVIDLKNTQKPSLLTKTLLKTYISKQKEHENIISNKKSILLDKVKKENILDIWSDNNDINLFNAHINAYYKNKKELGMKIGCFLINNKIDMNRQQLISNQLFYIKSLKGIEHVNVYELTKAFFNVDNPKDEYQDNKYNVLNPSLYKDENKDIWVNIRHVSFHSKNYIPMSKDNKVKTRNTFGKLNRTTCTIDEIKYEIIDCADYKKINNRVLGFEDIKIFRYKNRWCFSCTSYETSRTTNVLFGRLDSKSNDNHIWETHDVIPLFGDMVTENKPEKNWAPILNNSNELSFLYSTFPLHIVTLDEANKKVITTIKKEWEQNIGDFRGSSCLVPYTLDDIYGYIYVIHEVYFTGKDRNYLHRFVWLSSDYSILKYSDPFFFENNNKIEYCNGLVYDEDEKLFYLSYGDDDKHAKLMTIPKNNVDILLSDLDNKTNTSDIYKASCFIDKYCC